MPIPLDISSSKIHLLILLLLVYMKLHYKHLGVLVHLTTHLGLSIHWAFGSTYMQG